jgi:hypothetical protein
MANYISEDDIEKAAIKLLLEQLDYKVRPISWTKN